MIKCKECGADFDKQLPECPFCGALNYTGAEAEYMQHLEGLRGDLAEMADDSEEAYKGTMKKSTLIIITTVCCLFLAVSLIIGVFFLFRSIFFKEEGADQQKAEIIWRNQYLDVLDEMTWCLYDAASVDYATTQDFYVYTEEELAMITSWQEETDTFYHEILGLSDEEILQMKTEIVSDDSLAIPTSKNCRKYLKKHFDF